MQEVTVVQGLQTEILELVVAARSECATQLLQVIVPEALVKEFCVDAALDKSGEVICVGMFHLCLQHFTAQHFKADIMQQQACRGIAIGRVGLDQGARRQHQRFAYFGGRYAVIQILERRLQDQAAIGLRQPLASRIEQGLQARRVERNAAAIVAGHHHAWLNCSCWSAFLRFRTFTGATLTIQHVGPCDLVFARTHQGQLNLILHILNVKSASGGLTPHQGIDHIVGQGRDHLTNTRGGCAVPAAHGEECLGHGNGDLGRLERHDGAVAANHLVLSVLGGAGHHWPGRIALRKAHRRGTRRHGRDNRLHGPVVSCCLNEPVTPRTRENAN